MAEGGIAPAGGEQAVVAGGSLAGMLAAWVLAEQGAQVTVVERDRLPDGPAPRKGVPQARHVHALLLRGWQILEEFFPGFRADLAAAGAPPLDLVADVLWFSPMGWGGRFPSGLVVQGCSRDLLEWTVRRRVRAHPRIRVREECDVTGLLAGATAVTGVRLRPRGAPAGSAEEKLAADLVVDAGGRNSRAVDWLAALGYPAPPETVINPFMGYASRIYAQPAGGVESWKGMLIGTALPAFGRGGVLFPLEDNRWIVTLAGMGRDYPPTDETGFLEFARSLRSPLLYEAIRGATPLSPIAGYRATENRLRHYERLRRRPERFLLLGDAVCAFNPVYGQGMAAAAQAAVALRAELRAQRRAHPDGDLTGLAARFQRRLARGNAPIWMMATGEDFRGPQTVGGRPGPLTRLMHHYMNRVILCATGNAQAHLTVLEALHLIAPPAALFRPAVLLPALTVSRRAAQRTGGRDSVLRPDTGV